MNQIIKTNRLIIIGIIFLSALTLLLVINSFVESKYSDAVNVKDVEIKNSKLDGSIEKIDSNFLIMNETSHLILIFGIFSTIITIVIGLLETRKNYFE